MLKTSIFKRVQEFVDREGLFLPGQTLVVGLSGGPDSVFLLHFLGHLRAQYNLTLIAVHLDHGWRENSPQDAKFCAQLCAAANIPLVTKHLRDLPAQKSTGSLEQDARRARRHFFQEVAAAHQADAIALAHHQDDVFETFFIRLIRGSGLTGLTSIRPRSGEYIRPLLELTKQEILEYLDSNQIAYCHDQTNEDITFLRNAIRHKLLPAYRALDKRAEDNLQRTIEQLRQVDDYLEERAQHAYKGMVTDGWLNLDSFFELDAVIQHRVLLQWLIAAGVPFTPTEKFFAEITRFFKQPGSKTHAVSEQWKISKQKNRAAIKR